MSFLIWCLVLFCLSFLFCYNMMGVRDLLYRRLSWVWETCHTLSLFFWRPVLFCLSCLFCIIWWVWEICHTVEYDGCERPVIPCSSFSYVESLLFFFILCTGLSTFKRCKMEYIGETGRQLKIRMKEHETDSKVDILKKSGKKKKINYLVFRSIWRRKNNN